MDLLRGFLLAQSQSKAPKKDSKLGLVAQGALTGYVLALGVQLAFKMLF